MKHTGSQKGFVSIFTVAFFSLLITIITLSTLAVQSRELRLSTDVDQSTRAFFAAQAGLEAAIKQVKQNPNITRNLPADCVDPASVGVNVNFPAGSELEITCLLITDSETVNEGDLLQEVSTQVKLHGRTLRQIDLRWHRVDPLSNNNEYLNDPMYQSDNGLPNNLKKWSLPAVIELTVYSYPRNGLTLGNIQARTILLRPHANGPANFEADINVTDQVQKIKCENTLDFACRAKIKITDAPDFSPDNFYHVVRFRPRYNGTSFRSFFSPNISCNVEAGESECPIIRISAERSRIEVTARAGDVLRRLVAFASNEVEPFSVGLDYVILTQGDICKNMTVPFSTGRVTPSPNNVENCSQGADNPTDGGE